MSATIVFRGLLLFHYMDDGDQPAHMEIGVVSDGTEGHVPRIITTKNGVISSIFDLRTRPEFGNVRDWELEVTNPLQPTATKFQQGENFDRRSHPYARDFRWTIDLEGPDLHNKNLTADIDTSKLPLVLRVRHGEFYAQQLSKPLVRKTVTPHGQPDRYFGMTAEVQGCDIAFDIGTLKLKAGNAVAFTFDQGTDDGVIYEFSNAPPDVPVQAPYPKDGGHFPMYYHHLFRDHHPALEFNLEPEDDPNPAPDPATCGGIQLGSSPGGI